MDTVKPIENKVEQRGVITIDLADYYPLPSDVKAIDIKQFLFQGLILKEKDFRKAIEEFDWSVYQNEYVAISCSTDAIVPMWAYMLLTVSLSGIARDIACADPEHAADIFLYRNISAINFSEFTDKRVVVKGCGERNIPEAAFVQITSMLAKQVRSVMYGEVCSSVPVFKKRVD